MKFLLIAAAVIAAILFLGRPDPQAQAAPPAFQIQPIAQPASPMPAKCDCNPCDCEGCCLDYPTARKLADAMGAGLLICTGKLTAADVDRAARERLIPCAAWANCPKPHGTAYVKCADGEYYAANALQASCDLSGNCSTGSCSASGCEVSGGCASGNCGANATRFFRRR